MILKYFALFLLALALVLGIEHAFNRFGDDPLTRPPSALDTFLAAASSAVSSGEGGGRMGVATRGSNRLVDEKSPYLLQHADNPVDWYPWGEEAFARARDENKPIFLSVGYSTCHWCHVMNRESFSDPETAALMNEHFVNIKLDREERPDVDRTYMTFVRATTGGGGWPMSVWLTPELEPIVGGTYFPPEDNYGRPGFRTVLRRIADAWEQDREGITQQASRVTEQLRNFAERRVTGGNLPTRDLLSAAVSHLTASYDSTYGGFGEPPRFPRASTFNLLHAVAAQPELEGDLRSSALTMSAETLRKIAHGGIYDHIGGGFHRYSVDRYWHIPHYEKMLYDQAQMAVAYTDAYRLTGDEFFAEVARGVLRYVSRDMTGPGGGFYSAEDADSLPSADADHKTEGAFYVWEKEEIDEVLGENAPLFNYVYGVESKGNARPESDPHEELTGTNTFYRKHTSEEVAEKFSLSESEVDSRLRQAREALFEVRETKPRPHLDDKVITSWNGLMISAYARAYQTLGDADYLDHATGAARFLKENLYDAGRQRLVRTYREGPSNIDGFAADYAFLIQGLLDLYEAGFDVEWLRWAEELQEQQDRLFADQSGGGYFATTGEDKSVLLRTKEDYDGAEPSENSVSALNLLRLSSMLDRSEWRQQAEGLLRGFSQTLENIPQALPQMLVALDAAQGKAAQVVIAGASGGADTQRLLEIVRGHPKPHQVVLLADGGAGQEYLSSRAEFIGSISRIDGKATAYVCENFVCQLPTADPEEVLRLLKGDSKNKPGAKRSP